MTDLAAIWDNSFKLIAYNRPFEQWASQITGRPITTGLSVCELRPTDSAARWITKEALIRVADSRNPETQLLEYGLGSLYRAWEISLSPLVSDTGQFIGILQITRDQTLAKTTDRFQVASRALNGLVWEWKPFEPPSLWTRPVRPFLGYAPDDIGNTPNWWDNRVDPRDLPRCYAAFNEAIARRDNCLLLTYRFARADGTYALAEDHISIIYDPSTDSSAPVRFVGCMCDRTDNAQAQAALAASEARYRAVVNTSGAAVWTTDPTGQQVAFLSSGWSQTAAGFNVPPNTPIPSQIVIDTVHPDERQRIIDLWQNSIAHGHPLDTEHRMLMKDGTYRWFRVRGVPIRTEDGTVTEWVGTNTDIHDTKTADDIVRESERRFRLLAESMPEAIFICNADGSIQYVNPAYEAWSGYTLSELQALTANSSPEITTSLLAHPDEVHTLIDAGNALVARGSTQLIQFRYRLKNGNYRWVETRLTLIATDENRNKNICFAGALVDIEDRLKAESSLREQTLALEAERHWFETVLDATPIPILLVEQQSGRIIYVNQATRRLTRQIANVTDWEDFRSIIRKYDRHGVELVEEQRLTARAARGERLTSEEVVIRHPDGHVVRLLVDAEPVRAIAGQPPVTVVCLRDVTRLKHVEEELRSALGAKDRFLAVLSHELRTPLTPVLTMSQLLEADPTLSPETHDAVAMIRRNVELETRLIDDLLDLTRLSRGKVKLDTKPVHLAELLDNVIEICRAELNAKSIQLSLDTPDRNLPPLIVNADPARLHQVFWNLLKNSIKFTPERGRIVISLIPESAEITSRPSVQVRIQDTGIGIPVHLLPRVFDAFMQGDHDVRRYGGLGLGLAIAKALVELHGGTLTVHSPGHNQGADFRATFPLASPLTANPTPTPALRSSPPKTALNILLIEDHVDTARIMQRLLTRFGHTSTIKGSVSTAVDALRHTTFDLIISDIGLPDGSGCDVLEQTHGTHPPAIALSGFGMDDDIQRSRSAGFFEHLTKPVDAHILYDAITRATASTTKI